MERCHSALEKSCYSGNFIFFLKTQFLKNGILKNYLDFQGTDSGNLEIVPMLEDESTKAF